MSGPKEEKGFLARSILFHRSRRQGAPLLALRAPLLAGVAGRPAWTAALRWNHSGTGNPARRRSNMSIHNLYCRSIDGTLESASSAQILRAAQQVIAHRMRRGASLSSPHKVREYLTVRLGNLDHEIFALILLDKRHRVIEYVELFRGTIDGASVHPREVVKLVLEKGAAACVLVHNHPSGVKDQSTADELITKHLRDALALIDVRVVDHLIVGSGSVLSFAEAGLL
jgi:DNA repair protein RadC